MKKLPLLVLSVCMTILLAACSGEIEVSNLETVETEILEEQQINEEAEEAESLNLSIDITEHYIRNKGTPGNLYYIDADNVLWGSGSNEYGQLGQGTQDYEKHQKPVKIAENVIHVDFSQMGFTIYLTEDKKLYGIGCAANGALGQYADFDWSRYRNKDKYTVTTPKLLMEDVIYACCGMEDVVCLKEDGTVWTWGTVYASSYGVSFLPWAEIILEDAVFITGGAWNHAALLRDGTVWTWGNNDRGNCGVEGSVWVSEPTMVAEDTVMVWTDLLIENIPEPTLEEIVDTWIGKTKYDMEYENIEEIGVYYPRCLANTVIQKSDGSYFVCGENVGREEKTVYAAEASYQVVYSHEFWPCEKVLE